MSKLYKQRISDIVEEMAKVKEYGKKKKEEQEKKEARIKDKMEERELKREMGEKRRKAIKEYHNMVLDEMMGTALKGIYISALEKHDIMNRQSYAFCEARVDQFIKEQGGAVNMLGNMYGKTYLLTRIASLVEAAADEADEKTDDDSKEVGSIPHGCKEKMFDELEKEDDVDVAVDLITNRITDAEEEFIKKNAEDKKKIEDIVSGINDRIAAVKDDDEYTEEEQEGMEEELEEESARMISQVYNQDKPLPLFEFMVRNNINAVVHDEELRKMFQTESGLLDMGKLVDTTSYMYGFLEFVNTLQLVNVDEKYIQEVAQAIM